MSGRACHRRRVDSERILILVFTDKIARHRFFLFFTIIYFVLRSASGEVSRVSCGDVSDELMRSVTCQIVIFVFYV